MSSDLSVIIPSLGHEVLYDVVNTLLLSNKSPDEIIICVPDLKLIDNKKFTNPKIVCIESKINCQVTQRILAFRASTKKYVMQLDDDIFVDENTISNLLNHCISLGKNYCFAPLYLKKNNNSNSFIHSYGFYFDNNIKKILFNLFFYFFHSLPFGIKKLGKVSKCGVAFGVALKSENIDLIEVEWLPGGCVIQHRENFINENYYPLKGKAYTEDLIASHIRKLKNLKQFVSTKSIVYTEQIYKEASLNSNFFFKNLFNEFISKKYYVKFSKKNLKLFYLWFFLYSLKRIFNYIKIKIIKNENS